MKPSAFAICLLCSGLLAAGSARADELIVSAAASLTNAFKDIAGAFEKTASDTKVILNFAASGALLQQIDNGAPVDVFASADQETMDKAADKRLLAPGSRRDFASNRLVLIQPRAAAPVRSAAELSNDSIKRIGVGNPASVPVGRYTREVLQTEGLWDALTPKFILAESVRQVLDYVARGEVDAGFVYATDAAIAQDRVAVAAVLATQRPVLYPIAAVSASKRSARAQAFIAFVTGPAGRAILDKYGFGKP